MFIHLLLFLVRSAWNICLFCQPSWLHSTCMTKFLLCLLLVYNPAPPKHTHFDLQLSKERQNHCFISSAKQNVSPPTDVQLCYLQSHQWSPNHVRCCLWFNQTTDLLRHMILRSSVSAMPQNSTQGQTFPLLPDICGVSFLYQYDIISSFKCPKCHGSLYFP